MIILVLLVVVLLFQMMMQILGASGIAALSTDDANTWCFWYGLPKARRVALMQWRAALGEAHGSHAMEGVDLRVRLRISVRFVETF